MSGSLNRFFVSEYFRTPRLLQRRGLANPLSQSLLRQRILPDNREAYRKLLGLKSLNRFFVSEYFRTASGALSDLLDANTSQSLLRQRILPDGRVAHGYLSGNDGLNRFFVSEYFRTVVWLMDIFRETMVSIASSSANTSGRRQVAGRIHCKKGSQSLLRQRILPDRGKIERKKEISTLSQSLLRQRILPDVYAATCSSRGRYPVSIASSSANTSGLSKNVRQRRYHGRSQSLLRQRILPDVSSTGAVTASFFMSLNRFFVSEYFRT